MIGVPPFPVTAPAPSLTSFLWWYIPPGRLFGLRLSDDGRPLEVAFGTLTPAGALAADAFREGDDRPLWCPQDDSGRQGYALCYAPFPPSGPLSGQLTGQASPELPAEPPRPPASSSAPTGDIAPVVVQQPMSQEEVDLGLQLQFPVCSFLKEARADLRLHAHYAAQGQLIMNRIGDRISVTTTVRNLLPLQDPLPNGLYFYEAWLEQVAPDGTVSVAVPAGAISVGEDGTGTGYREFAADNVDGTGLPIDAFNGTAVTAQPRGSAIGQSEYVILEGTLPRTVKW